MCVLPCVSTALEFLHPHHLHLSVRCCEQILRAILQPETHTHTHALGEHTHRVCYGGDGGTDVSLNVFSFLL